MFFEVFGQTWNTVRIKKSLLIIVKKIFQIGLKFFLKTKKDEKII